MDEQLLERLRPKGFAIAYRMLGSVSEAEEVVQEALVRIYREIEGGNEIENPEGFFSTVVTRLAIDELRSARARREVYTGEWLPEPIITGDAEDPARHAEIADSLSLGLLVVLETLSPEERAVFLLREVFDYPHERIAEVLDKKPPAVRQIASRARRRVGAREPRFETSEEQRERLTARFFDAFEDGDLAALEEVLAAEAELHGDGGGKAPALSRPLQGRARVARTLLTFGQLAGRLGLEIRRVEVNGQPGALGLDQDGKLLNVISLEIAEGQITTVRSVVNPDKLGHLGVVGDVNAILAAGRKGRHS
jgi:RNA polymerase sigma-70 factor (ECF subfamily)